MYCDIEGSHCDGEGGWTRVAFVNMNVPISSCLSRKTKVIISFNQLVHNETSSLYDAVFSAYGLNYTKMCVLSEWMLI